MNPVRDPQRFAPVFVLAAPRSYSSVITTMIGQHPELAGLPELKLFLYPTLGELDASLPTPLRDAGVAHRSPGLVRAIAQFEFGSQSPDAIHTALAWLNERAAWSGADVLDHLLARVAPRATVEKSPENVMTSTALGRIAAAYPRGRYIHLVRHPNTAARSMETHWARTMPAERTAEPEVTWLATWMTTHRRILRAVRIVPAGRYLRVRAEDVLGDTARQLGRIARWLGVRDDADAVTAMRHPETSVFARFGPAGSGVTGGHDPAFLTDPVPRPVPVPPSIERPAPWNGGEELWSQIVGLAGELGYGETVESPNGAAAAVGA